MASDDRRLGRGEPGWLSDIPSTSLTISDKQAANRLARRAAGEPIPDECRFICISCGWDKTLHFSADEMEALGGDIRSYTGPCASCGKEMLRPWDMFLGEEFRPLQQRAKDNRRQEYAEQADVFIDRFGDRLQDVLGFGNGSHPGERAPERNDPPGKRSDLPRDEDIDLSDLKPRQGT